MKQNGKPIPAMILLVAVILVLPWSCSTPRDEPGGQDAAGAEEVIFTREDPGAYGGKEDSHVPIVTYEKTASGLKVAVRVDHEMNAETPHYIMWIQLKDGRGNLLGEQAFQASDEKAEAVFDLTTVPERLVALEKCNIHGTWKDEVDVT